MEQIRMYHPDVPHTKETPVVRSKKQYEAVWKDKGWKLWKPSTAKSTKKENSE